MNDEPIIVADGMSFRYGPEDILTDISFEIPAGGYVGILGANGSGKTTLIKLIVGLLTPAAGTLRLFGSDPRLFRGWEQVGYVPQHVFKNDQNFPATVEEIVASGLGSDERRLSKIERKACIERALAAARVEHVAKRRIGELSGGERQRAFIARALATQPRLLILDEPTTGIDRTSEREFYALLKELNDKGMTILLISHDLDAVSREVKQVLCLNRRLVYFGTPAALRSSETLQEMYGDGKQALFHSHEH
ncbi:MAG: metal ABC transporter ATP-binding protein [Candidatus Moranbacteria bacterium]|nr:metal ABC transporter ATP-binding protein [Candidatus Moranbacteria bacterium]MBP6034420.1 metal ABC transporter ATP-binding protein [Candidatus Moranbacteria bacterium]MBP7695703.1 metal ABC transporter ATP-binding protein [Candidatus Moranbacteria bacterium]